MEYLRGGQLLQFMFEKGKLDEKTTQMILLQLADAVSYLHARRIMHRDLKPENIIMENHTNDVKVKIVDFGFATIDNELTNSPAKTICGTAGYLAPEVLKTRIYSRKVDIWSLGVITFIMLSGSMPFETSFTDENARVSAYFLLVFVLVSCVVIVPNPY